MPIMQGVVCVKTNIFVVLILGFIRLKFCDFIINKNHVRFITSVSL